MFNEFWAIFVNAFDSGARIFETKPVLQFAQKLTGFFYTLSVFSGRIYQNARKFVALDRESFDQNLDLSKQVNNFNHSNNLFNMSIKDMLGSVEEQRELFLMKFPDVERIDVMDMYEAFIKYDVSKDGAVNEREVQLMMGDLGVHKTLIELRAMLSAIDFTAGKSVQFMELCCASFGKDFSAMLDHTDHSAVENAKAKAIEQQRLLDEIAAKHAAEDESAKKLADTLEAESHLVSIFTFHSLTAYL